MRSVDVLDADRAGRGSSSTPFFGEISKIGAKPWLLHAVGVDEIRVCFSVSGVTKSVCEALTEHTWRPKGMPGMHFLGSPRMDGFKRSFSYLLGDLSEGRAMYHRDSGVVHVRIHFPGLIGVQAVQAGVLEHVAALEAHGVEVPYSAVRVARIDYAADVVFSAGDLFQYVHSAVGAMLPGRGRVVQPVKYSLYLYASKSPRAKRLGRIYDKGRELAEVHGYDLPAHRYMRFEAEVLHDTRPMLHDLTRDEASATFLDRFGAVGRGTLALKGGLVDPLMRLLIAGAITPSQFERLYAFLDMCRMGRADELYAQNRDLYLSRAREARTLGLEVPGLEDRSDKSLEDELDVRALVHEIAGAF